MNGFLIGPMRHKFSCLGYVCCDCVVSEQCPVCLPGADGVLCATHRNQANKFARSTETASSQTMDEHEAHLGAC